MLIMGGLTPGSSCLGVCPHKQRGHAHVHHRGIPASLVDRRTSDAGTKAARVGKYKECRRTKSGVDGARDDVGGDVLHVRVPKLRLPEYSCGGSYVSQESRGTPRTARYEYAGRRIEAGDSAPCMPMVAPWAVSQPGGTANALGGP